jgi:hypothetical protein
MYAKKPHRVFQANVKDMAAEGKRVKEKAKEKEQFTSQLFVPYITKMKRAKRLQFAVKCGTKM